MVKTVAYLKVILIIFIAFIWIVSCSSFFELQISTREVIIDNQTVSVENKVLVFRDDVFGNLTVTSILGPIAGGSASILAIVFAISNLIISNISERYSPYILKIYEEEAPTRRTLYSFVLIAGFSVVLLFIYRLIPSIFSFMFLMLTITGFIVALFLLVDYFFYMFKIINPLKFGDVLKRKTLQFVESQDEKEAQEYVIALGDVAVRAYDRKEVTICTLYIKLLADVFRRYMQLRKQEPKKYKLIVDPWNSSKKQNCVLLYIIEEYYRIFRYSVLQKEETISNEIVRNHFDILYETLFAEDNDDLVTQILETRNIIGAKFYPFYKLAIENEDPSRFHFMQSLVAVLAINLRKKEKIKDNNLEAFLNFHIFRLTQMVIDHKDFDLFTREINNFSLMLPMRPPDEIQNDICTSLWLDVPTILYRDKKFMEELQRRRAHITHLVKNESTRDFKKARELDKNLEDYQSFLVGQVGKLQDKDYVKTLLHENAFDQIQKLTSESQAYVLEITTKIEDMKEHAYELYVTSQICKMFFMIGGYLLFKEKEKVIDSVVYMKELWSHTTPEDADSIILNRSPITFNPFWLSNLLMYNGVGSDLRFDFLSFGDFHGVTDYVNKYYLLAIEKTKESLIVPSTEKLETLKKDGLFSELNYWYHFSDDFSSQSFVNNLLSYCDCLIQQAETFDRLLSTKSKDEKGGIQVIKAKEKLENLRNWIESKTKEFEGKKQEIVSLLPLDSSQIEKCKAKILEAYHNATEIDNIVKTIIPFQENGKGLPPVQIDQSPMSLWVPKDCLIKPSLVDCSQIWYDLGRHVAFGEMNYFIGKILGCKEIERLVVTVQENEGGKSSIKVLAKTTVNLEIENSKSLKILQIKEAQ
jgi:hypothetical protein